LTGSEPKALAVQLIAMVQGVSTVRRPVTSSDALYQDLRIMGDDAFELLQRISARFDVSLTGLSFPLYFPDEASAPFIYLKAKLGWRDRTRRRLTVGHLIAV